ESVVLGNVAVMGWILGKREANAGRDPASSLVGLRPRHHAKRNFARPQRRDPGGAADPLAVGRQARGDGHEMRLLDVGAAQGLFERCQGMAMDTDDMGEEYASRNGKHRPLGCSNGILTGLMP